MPSLTRPPCLLVSASGRLAAKTTRFTALAFPSGPAAVSLSPFVVISCVAEGSAGTPLCFTGRDLALAQTAVFLPL